MAFPGLFPWIVDGSLIGFSVASLGATLAKRENLWYLTLTIVFTVISVMFNVWHVRELDVMAKVCHGFPPIVTLFLFEVMLREIAQTQMMTQEKVTKEDRAPIEPLPAKEKRAKKPKTTYGTGVMAKKARELGVSLRTLYRQKAKGVNV